MPLLLRWPDRLAAGTTSSQVGLTMRTDPGERLDVAQQHPDLVHQLRALVAGWEADIDAERRTRTSGAKP